MMGHRFVRGLAVALVAAGCNASDSRAERGAPMKRESLAIPAETARALEALGYFPRAPTHNPSERGVVARAETSSPGLNLYTSRRWASAVLTDLTGAVVHRWRDGSLHERVPSWMHVEPMRDGSLLVIAKDHHVSRRDWDSNLIWRRPLRAHHDLTVDADGRILVLVREETVLETSGRALPVLADGVAVLSASGELLRTADLLPLFGELVPPDRIARIRARLAGGERASLVRPGGLADVLHTNSIERLHREIPGVAPRGALLLSFRALSRIAIVDAALTRVLFMWGEGELDGQHDAKQLASGRLLVFDNGLRRGARSRVLEVDAQTREIVWSYAAPGLFTRLRGGAQELPNGNILITESDEGHAFEVSRGGEVVWEFWNPNVIGHGRDAERDVIYRLNRFPNVFFQPLHSR